MITCVLLGNSFFMKQFLSGLCFYKTLSEAADIYLAFGRHCTMIRHSLNYSLCPKRKTFMKTIGDVIHRYLT